MAQVEYQPSAHRGALRMSAEKIESPSPTDPPDPGPGLRARDALFVFALAFGLRALAVLELADTELARVPVGDARGYIDWARRIAGGEWFGNEVFYQAPLYPYVLGTLFALVGENLFGVRLVQGCLGALACAGLGVVAGRMAGRRAGLWSGVGAAVYAPWIWTDGLLQKTSLGLALLVALLFLCERARSWKAPAWAVLSGAIAGLLVLTRENAAILALPVAIYLVRVGGWTRLAYASLGLALVLAPVGWRNATLGGAFLPTASNVGVNLYIGNGPKADGFYVPLVAGRGHADFEARDARFLAEAQRGTSLTSAEVSAHFASLAGEAIADDPGRALRLVGKKALCLAGDQEYMDATAYEAYRDESIVLTVLGAIARFGWLLPLALAGFIARPRNDMALLLWGCALALLLGLLPFFVTGRFRMGFVPLLLPFAPLGARVLFAPGTPGIQRWKAIALALIAAAVTWIPMAPPGSPRATSYANLSSELFRHGEYERAEAAAARGLGADPLDAATLYNRGMALKFLGRLEEADRAFEKTIQASRDYAADAWAELGALQAMRGRGPGAEANLGRALALDPENAQAHYYIGLLRRQEGELEAASASYEIALQSRPDFADARHNLAHVRLAQKRAADAIRLLETNVERSPRFLSSLKLLASLLATHPDAALRNGETALAYAERFLVLGDADDPEAHAIQAYALAELARFQEAEAALERAQAVDARPERWEPALLQVRAGRPVHAEPLPSD